MMGVRSFFSVNDAISVVPDGADRHAIRNFDFMNSEQPASVGKLAYTLGFEVQFKEMHPSVSAQLQPDTWSAKGWEIVVNAKHHKGRQRFSALHEIAHYYLHAPASDFLSAPRHRASGQSFEKIYSAAEWNEEQEANSWADAVIFGNGALDAAMSLFGSNLTALSRHFGFSEVVVEKAIEKRKTT